MNFAADPVQTQTPQSIDLWFLTINALDEVSVLITPSTRIQRPADGAHLIASNHVVGETAAVGVNEEKYENTITIKLSYKFGRKINNLNAKTFQLFDHL